VLILLLFIGGCSLSTAGSLKVIRVVVLFKMVKRGILKQIHPNIVKAIMLDENQPVSSKRVAAITAHTLTFFAVIVLGCLLLSLNNLDMETTATTTIGLFTNSGLALGLPGTSGYFGIFNEFSQLVMCFLMIAGRLEMYAIIIMFTKSFWSPDRATSM
jgi:trk system potassium uptake protein TrkH